MVKYTRSSDSAPSISAILRLVLIKKLPKSSFSALLELNRNSFPSDQCSFLAYFKQCSLNQCSVFVGPKRALSEDLVYLTNVRIAADQANYVITQTYLQLHGDSAVNIYDGGSTIDGILTSMMGNHDSVQVYSTGSQLFVEFANNGNGVAQSFSASIKFGKYQIQTLKIRIL